LADIYDLSVLSNSKLLERLVNWHLLDHVAAAKLLLELQSVFLAHHSTETAVLKVVADILSALDTGDVAVLTFDLSAAFDTVDHATFYIVATPEDVIRYRRQCIGPTRMVHIVSQRSHSVRCGMSTSDASVGNQLDRLQSVTDECRSTACLLRTKVRAHNGASPRPSLVAGT